MVSEKDVKQEFLCDSHMHILDPRYPYDADAVIKPKFATMDEYKVFRADLGITHTVIVQPSCHGTDNSCTREALEELGPFGRAIAVIKPETSKSEISALDREGYCGVRFNLLQGRSINADDIVPMARAIDNFGWHLQFHGLPEKFAEIAPILRDIDIPVVFDHLAMIRDPDGADRDAFELVCDLCDAGRGWVKLSGEYLRGVPGGQVDIGFRDTALRLVGMFPDRIVWGSDWPHATEPVRPPANTILDPLEAVAKSHSLQRRILWDNAAKLYGFSV